MQTRHRLIPLVLVVAPISSMIARIQRLFSCFYCLLLLWFVYLTHSSQMSINSCLFLLDILACIDVGPVLFGFACFAYIFVFCHSLMPNVRSRESIYKLDIIQFKTDEIEQKWQWKHSGRFELNPKAKNLKQHFSSFFWALNKDFWNDFQNDSNNLWSICNQIQIENDI